MKLFQLLISTMEMIIQHEIENNFGSRRREEGVLAGGGQRRSFWEGIWVKISKIKNVAAMEISGENFLRKGE